MPADQEGCQGWPPQACGGTRPPSENIIRIERALALNFCFGVSKCSDLSNLGWTKWILTPSPARLAGILRIARARGVVKVVKMGRLGMLR